MPVQLFQGFDTFAGSHRATVLTGDSKSRDSRQELKYTMCETVEELYNALKISAKVAANFGFVGADAKSEYVHSMRITSTSLVIAIYANKVLGTQEYTSISLKGIKPEESLNDFYKTYGDSFVNSITTGGEYIATYVFRCQSTEERKNVKASLQADGVTGSGIVSATMMDAIGKAGKTLQGNVDFSHNLFGFTNLVKPDQDGLVEFARNLGQHTPDVPTVIDFTTVGYEHARGMDSEMWQPISDNRSMFEGDISAQAQALDCLANQIHWIHHIYQTYGYDQDKDLRVKQNDVNRDVRKLKDAIAQLTKNPTLKFEVPELQTLGRGVPKLNFEGPYCPTSWGGNGGTEFTDIGRQQICAGQKLQKVSLRGGSYVDRLKCVYANGPTFCHGGEGGHDAPTLELDADEFITTLSGRVGFYVDYLQIKTSRNRSRHAGGERGDRGTPFEDWHVPPGSVVVGFEGSCGSYLDRVGPLICTFHPATWSDAFAVTAS
jgi:Jacalin-like lectin domain